MEFGVGDLLTVRGERWVVDDATEFTDCAVLTLSAAESFGGPPLHQERSGVPRHTCELLLPFDRPIKSTGLPRIRAMTRTRWMRHLHSALSELRMFGTLREVAGAGIDILPFQLEPALALISGRASRFLLADEVGLGKTIQAGLMLAELRRRGWCDRALILTPPGLRMQWAEELQQRFHISAAVVDTAALSTLVNGLPLDVNPWTVEQVCIASIDFVKQPEVLRGLCREIWDLLIVDEAHHASAPSLRYEAANALASRSRHVVLLTATPHAGNDPAYRALCELGRVDRADPILLFRRTRHQTILPRTRRAHLLRVRLTPEALQMHSLLAAYVARLWHIAHATGRQEVQLAAMVLSKRAFSSAGSLASSVERRLSAISGLPPIPLQTSLPFEADAELADEAPLPSAPAFDSPSEEEAVLRRLLDAARRAQDDEGKVRVLRTLLQRVREPVVVFTEYRDTLERLEMAFAHLRKSVVLHGGQLPHQRRDAVQAFTSGLADLLLATDAGAEGLNLQNRCRLVVNLELPWNPIRLEQRIGRVDRIGQSRTVHAINLLAEGTAESTVLATLLRRLDCIQASEIEVAASVISSAPLPSRSVEHTIEGCTERVDLRDRAHVEAARLATVRVDIQRGSSQRERIIPVACTRIVRGSAIFLVRIRIVDGVGRLVEDTLVPLSVPDERAADEDRTIGARARELVDRIGPAAIAFARRLGHERAKAIGVESGGWVERARRREDYLSRTAGAATPSLVQAGLFDSRAVRSRQDSTRQERNLRDQCADRSASLEAGATASLAHEPHIAFVLIAC